MAGGAGRSLTIRGVLDVVVEFAVASHLGKEQGHGGDADPGQGAQGIGDLPAHLVLWGVARGVRGTGGISWLTWFCGVCGKRAQGSPGSVGCGKRDQGHNGHLKPPMPLIRPGGLASWPPLRHGICATVWDTGCCSHGDSCAWGRAGLTLGVGFRALWHWLLARDDQRQQQDEMDGCDSGDSSCHNTGR